MVSFYRLSEVRECLVFPNSPFWQRPVIFASGVVHLINVDLCVAPLGQFGGVHKPLLEDLGRAQAEGGVAAGLKSCNYNFKFEKRLSAGSFEQNLQTHVFESY